MTSLTLHNVDTADRLVSPERTTDIEPRSSALTLFTDFRRREPPVIDGWMPAEDARRVLDHGRSSLRLVVGRHGEFMGTIAIEHVSEANVIKKVAAGEHRREVLVMDLMVHRHELSALSYGDLWRSTVADVLDTLRHHGATHCLVVDVGARRIRGLIAADEIARRLQHRLEMNGAPTFAAVFAALAG